MVRAGRFLVALLLCGVVLSLSSCSSGPLFGIVNGQVKVKGKKADKIRVEFHPNALRGTDGPTSTGETDAEGRFTLVCTHSDRVTPGAMVGWHKVVLHDLRYAESETGRDVVMRFHPDHGMVLSTPLEVEVKAGEHSVTIEVAK